MGLIGRVCTRGIWDESIPGITFNDNGVSNYALLYEKLCHEYPRGSKGKIVWDDIVLQIQKKGKNKKYNCIVGVSGGTDSSFLMHLLKKEYCLNPLAVTLDNGWNSDYSVKNIKRMCNSLDIDLETYVIDYEEMKKVHLAYMKAGIPWIDTPTDFAIKNVLLQIANRENIYFVLNGHDFRSEGTQPNEWTHGDSRQFNYIIKYFGNVKIKSFPYQNYLTQIYLSTIKGIKSIKPFFYLDYKKRDAQDFLKKEYCWEYYGGHHHENLFTKFAIAFWLVKKFGIDKRKITLSAQILNGEITREKAISEIMESPYDQDMMDKDKDYVIKKLDLSERDFNLLMNDINKSIYDYPSFISLFNKYSFITKLLVKLVYKETPTFFYQLDNRKNK